MSVTLYPSTMPLTRITPHAILWDVKIMSQLATKKSKHFKNAVLFHSACASPDCSRIRDIDVLIVRAGFDGYLIYARSMREEGGGGGGLVE